MLDPRTKQAVQIMTRFAERTGVTDPRVSRRYLWTEAFAVCNFLDFGHATGERRFVELELHLVDRVHHTRGRHRADDTAGHVRRGDAAVSQRALAPWQMSTRCLLRSSTVMGEKYRRAIDPSFSNGRTAMGRDAIARAYRRRRSTKRSTASIQVSAPDGHGGRAGRAARACPHS